MSFPRVWRVETGRWGDHLRPGNHGALAHCPHPWPVIAWVRCSWSRARERIRIVPIAESPIRGERGNHIGSVGRVLVKR